MRYVMRGLRGWKSARAFALATLATLALTCNAYQLCGTAPMRQGTAFSEVTPSHWPWNAAIHTIAKFRPEQYCSGALINDRHVVTAAHCVDKRRSDGLRVHLGSWRRNVLDEGEVALPVKELCIHQNYSGSANDIAIIKLAEPVEFTSRIRPICLPRRNEHLPKDSEAYTTGWSARKGKPTRRTRRTLQELKLTLMNKMKCVNSFDVILSEDVLCAPHDYGSLCEGDSGAPVMQNVGGQWFLQGVLSGGPATCGDPTLPMVFTRIASFVDNFITAYLKARTESQKVAICTLK
ncbi:hypothetical protein V5799_004485 [Amblyomma americanum]|uniref:Peptidase S1 domain-containing protein n=1 Tax=Amblyomma americanum TaxID=6943 RepID=A0AAQ4D5Z2_AMBAM